MRFAYHPGMCDPAHYFPLAKYVEEVGFDGFSFPDSICYPKEASSKYPYNDDGSREFLDGVPFLEPFCAIPALAAVTEKLTFSTSVVKLPIRNPVLVAKQAATIAVMSDNRFVFGVGISPWYEDFEICGERWPGRGKRMDEMIDIMRGLWTGDYYGHNSEFYQIPECKICPAPTQQIPILIGGHSDAAFKRTALRGDGFISAGNSLAELTQMSEKLTALRQEYGTINKPFQFHAITREAYSADGIKRLEDIGVTEVIISFRNVYEKAEDPPYQQKIDTINWYVENVIEKSR